MTKTVKEHFDDCRNVSDVIDNANALLTKCQAELKAARELLSALTEYQHPKLIMHAPYHLRSKNSEDKSTPKRLINEQVSRINTLLGDRA